MQTRCPHCEKPIEPGAILCMNCGSYVVKVEEKQRRWHLFAIPAVMVVALAGLLLYMELRISEVETRRQAEMEEQRALDPARKRQLEEDEAERQRIVQRREQIDKEKRRRERIRKLNEVWKAMPTADKLTYLQRQLDRARGRIGALKGASESEATQDLMKFLEKLDAKVGVVVTFIDAKQLDQARGVIEGVIKELDDIAPEPPGTQIPALPIDGGSSATVTTGAIGDDDDEEIDVDKLKAPELPEASRPSN
ncbi:MAG: zinc ribbon domain-containing protein [Deltaproteobacteria bacterium]|nr:zinc ribbon domain-containing protein [Deltaproteobacteria bacterium]